MKNLKRYYKSFEQEPGILSSLLNRKRKTVKAIDDISFSLSRGELVGLIGPNGAGKTTILKCLSGILTPDSGKISVLGFSPANRQSAFKKRIGFVTGQKYQLFWDLAPIETFNLNQAVYEIPPDVFAANLNTLISLLRVEKVIKTQTRKLSLGERMKCELIAALLHNPEVLFLDEPTIGLDVMAQKAIRDFIKNYNRQHQSTIILTSHSMDDVKNLCEKVYIIDQGKFIFKGKVEDIIQRYEENKEVKVFFSEPVDEDKLRSIATLDLYQYPKAVLSVKKEETPKVVSQILQQFPVSDMSISELSLEEAIRKIFSKEEKINDLQINSPK